MSHFQIPLPLTAYNAYPKNNPSKIVFPNWCILDWSFAVIGWYSTNEPNGIIGPVAQNVFHKASSHQIIDLWRFAVESAHQFSFRPDCNNTAEVPSFTLRTALSAIPCVSDLCGVDVSFAEFQGIVSVNDLRLPIGLQELLQASLSFLWSFCFARICLEPLSGWVLNHDCMSVIVSRIAIVTENFVICCYQVARISARGTALPLRLLHGALVILVLWQISQFRSLGKWV